MWNNSLNTNRKLEERLCITNGVINMCPKLVKKEEAIKLGAEPQEKDTEKEKNTKSSEVPQCEQIQAV